VIDGALRSANELTESSESVRMVVSADGTKRSSSDDDDFIEIVESPEKKQRLSLTIQ
jgi:hypothetical protein